MKQIDIIVPCYNESEVLELFYKTTDEILSKVKNYMFRYVFIDDGSSDDTLKILKDIASQTRNVKYISFSRNFGKESAMYAGLKNATGDYAVIMDADLQHPPALIPEMIEHVEEGYDCCGARRATRDGDPKLRTFFSRLFYKLINYISDVEMTDGAGDFRLINRRMIDAIVALGEVQRFSKGIFSWIGFKTYWIEFNDVERAAGTSKWNFIKLLKYALDGIVAFSTKPLKLLPIVGVLLILSSCIFTICFAVFNVRSSNIYLYSYMQFISGIILLLLGIVTEYLSKIYIEVKNRPIYIIRDTNILNEKDDYKK